MEIAHTAGVSADAAAPASLFYELPLDSLKPAGNGFADASFASPPWPLLPVQRELRNAMPLAPALLRRALPVRVRGPTAVGTERNRGPELRIDLPALPFSFFCHHERTFETAAD